MNAVIKHFSPTITVLAYDEAEVCNQESYFTYAFRTHAVLSCGTIMLYKVIQAIKSTYKIPMSVPSNRIYAVFSCTLYRKIKLGTYFSLCHSWNDQVNDLFQQELHVKFLGCLVFFDVNFFQGLFWEFGDKSRHYRPVHNLSWHCLVLIQSP